jgi:hypothetical protein
MVDVGADVALEVPSNPNVGADVGKVADLRAVADPGCGVYPRGRGDNRREPVAVQSLAKRAAGGGTANGYADFIVGQ